MTWLRRRGGYDAGVSNPSAAPDPTPWPDVTPQAVRSGLLPEEAGDFDREFRREMADATETFDLTEVLSLLQRWQRVALSSRDAAAHRRMLEHADRLTVGDHVATEPWERTRTRLGR